MALSASFFPLRRLLLFCLSCCLAWPASALAQAQRAGDAVLTVAAASDLKFVLEDLLLGFTGESGVAPKVVFGSSGNLYSQLLQGAPFHLFLSADEQFVFKLYEAGKTRNTGRLYAHGRLALLVPSKGVLKADSHLSDLALALKDGRLKRLAIANPAHAPYGKRAEEALRHAGLWDGLSGRLVFGENVSQAAQFAVSGSAQGGIVAHSLALALQRRGQGDFALIPAAWHKPLAQRMVIMQSAPSSAQRLWDYLETPAAQAVWAAHGFVLGGGH